MKHSVLAGHGPADVLRFFEDICAIPHVSGDERALSDYVVQFAADRGLFCRRDDANNVFIRLPASPDRVDAPAVMLQGHLDMVGEKDADSDHDFAADGLKLRVVELDGDAWITATGTTLGGDDGIAVAIMLAILDAPPVSHPAVECLFTVSEEVGLEGAWAFDPATVNARATRMINLDSEAEGVLTAGCSGGMRTDITIPVRSVPADDGMTVLEVELSGLSGGHSGVQIHEGHANAIKLLGRLLRAVEWADGRLVTLSGGGKDNAIPRDARATLAVPREKAAHVIEVLEKTAETFHREPNFTGDDQGFVCTAVDRGEAPTVVMADESRRAVLSAIRLVRDGVLSMSAHVKGLVAYSRNLGILATNTGEDGASQSVTLSFSARSASESHLCDAKKEMDELAYVIGAVAGETVTATHRARYPGWDYVPVSPLRELWTATSERLYGVTPRVEVIHAGLECGILCDKMLAATGTVMDIISVGPDMRDIHTPREMLSIPSVERTYRLVREVLGEM